MKIESLRLRNYKVFRDVTLADLPDLGVFVGANGSGKSTLFDALAFLRDCLVGNVPRALDARGRFSEVNSRGSREPFIEIALTCRAGVSRLHYALRLVEESGAALVEREILRRADDPTPLLDVTRGRGVALADGAAAVEDIRLSSPDELAIKGLGQFERFGAASALRQLIEGWQAFDFRLDSAVGRREPNGQSEHLSPSGDNLPRVAWLLNQQQPRVFADIVARLRRHVPGLGAVEPVITADGYLALRFAEDAFETPLADRAMSDGTIRMLAYLVLLHDPKPHPLLCVEEPENQLYPRLMAELAEEFRDYARRGGQVMVSTHSPDFLNACEIDEVWWLVKQDGQTTVRRAKDDPQLAAYMADGDQMGYLWKQGFFEGADPR